MVWVSLLLLGLILYLLVQRGAARMSRTPAWLLWFVLMIPAFFIVAWMLIKGQQPIPSLLLISIFILSSFLYWLLLRRNLPPAPEVSTPKPEPPEPEAPRNLLNRAEEAQLQGCFPWSLYYLQQIEYRPQAVICRGQMRGQADQVYATIQDNIALQFGDRFLVTFQMGGSDKPFFALIPKQRIPSPGQLTRPLLTAALFCLTLFTTTLAGTALANPTLTPQEFLQAPQVLISGLAYSLPLLAILGIHESGHYFMAKYYQIQATLPYFIPIPFGLGTLGAFIQVRSPIPNRRALFDVGIAGPLAGFLLTLPILAWGLGQSELVALAQDSSNRFNLEAFNPRISILFALICRWVWGTDLTMTTGINLHPLAIAGVLGLVVTALNLMPVGQLDGGHIVHAMYGHRAGAIIGQITRLLILVLSFIQPWLFFWAIILFLMPAFDEPAVNDVTELNGWRDGLGLMALGLLILIIFPVPEPLAGLLLSTHPTP